MPASQPVGQPAKPKVVPAPATPTAPKQAAIRFDGIALSLYYEGPGPELRYEAMVDRIADAGARSISVVVQWAQTDVKATTIAPDPKETPSDADVRRVIAHARARGLDVLLFPILWVERRAIGEWRGTLAPSDPDAWWASYRRFVLHYARLAAETGASAYSVGSELASLEDRTARWHGIIDAVRAEYGGRLIYSANWDHYEEVTFWDRLDAIGLTAYYKLTDDPRASQARLTAAWKVIKQQLLAWQATVGKPMVFTELGYPSQDGAAVTPWDYTGVRDLDVEEQRRALAAFVEVWRDEPALEGVYFWNGWGPTDGRNGWYTFWGKPAEAIVRRWFADRRGIDGTK